MLAIFAAVAAAAPEKIGLARLVMFRRNAAENQLFAAVVRFHNPTCRDTIFIVAVFFDVKITAAIGTLKD